MSYKNYEDLIKDIVNGTNVEEASKLDAETIKKLSDLASGNLSAWDRVTIARDKDRPKAQEYIKVMFKDFIELHGDRFFGDDRAMITGLATFHDIPVTVIAQAKGRDLEENIQRNFGMSNPEGYRKVIRAAKQAEKFKRPIITFVDTSGAYPGKGAEERGQAEAIAKCLYEFSTLETPVICIVIGEGGSGGALALSVADSIIMLENAVYSVLSPEGFSSILWKDATRYKEASELMKLTAYDLKNKEIVDHIITEPIGGAQYNFEKVIKDLDKVLLNKILELRKIRISQLLNNRYKKYRDIGVY